MTADLPGGGDAAVAIPGRGVLLREVPPGQAADLGSGGTGGLAWPGGAPGEGTRMAAGLVTAASADGSYRPGWGMYVIVRAADGVAVGGIGFPRPPAAGRVEIGYDVVPAARGRGHATEGVRALTTWALTSPDVDTIIARTDAGNTASRTVLARAGFRQTAETDRTATYELRHRPPA